VRILILGGDGYLGWSTAMYFSSLGHDISVIDNNARRDLCKANDISFLFDAPELAERSNIWKSISGSDVKVAIGDLQDWDFISAVVGSFAPEAVIHYAEQPSAPYSMMNRDTAAYTLQNNVMGTLNMIHAVNEHVPDAHIIKLGTMGEYGTPNIEIEEGWLDIEHKGRQGRFLFPRQAGSLYHTSKILDTDLLWFYVRTWGLKVTDLMQGPVYGIHTDQSRLDDRLLPLFNYDEIFGTVINRFIVQAACGYPLTVYGKGEQRRGFLNVLDTLACVGLALENPAESGSLRIYNQFTEVFSVNQLAEKIARVGKQVGLDVKIDQIENPRVEAEEHFYQPVHTGLLSLGLEPHLLTDDAMAGMIETVLRHKSNIVKEQIFRGVNWKPSRGPSGLKAVH
jgi:UDP-sulfoquinovose synthase